MLLLLAATRVSWPCSRGINFQRKKSSWKSMRSPRMLESNATRTKVFAGFELGRLWSWDFGHSLIVTGRPIVFCKIFFSFYRGARHSSCPLLSKTPVSFSTLSLWAKQKSNVSFVSQSTTLSLPLSLDRFSFVPYINTIHHLPHHPSIVYPQCPTPIVISAFIPKLGKYSDNAVEWCKDRERSPYRKG